jgi:hypothetical protein
MFEVGSLIYLLAATLGKVVSTLRVFWKPDRDCKLNQVKLNP